MSNKDICILKNWVPDEDDSERITWVQRLIYKIFYTTHTIKMESKYLKVWNFLAIFNALLSSYVYIYEAAFALNTTT